MTKIEHLLKNLNTLRLDDKVRFRMRAELSSYADLHTVPTPVASVRTVLSVLRFRMYAGFAAFLLVIGSVGGTAYASSDALPGDTLYAVKIKLAEPLQTALVPSPKGKAAWHAILAERRLEEAAKLAASNELTPEMQEDIEANFETHVRKSVANAEQIAYAGDVVGSLSVRSDLEARITAHERILDVIADHYNARAANAGEEATKDSVKALLAVVQKHEVALTTSRLALEDVISPDSDTEVTLAKADEPAVARIAVAPHPEPAPAFSAARMFEGDMTPEARIAAEDATRNNEVQTILGKHALFLAKFLPPATTTPATSTASTTITATTTLEVND